MKTLSKPEAAELHPGLKTMSAFEKQCLVEAVLRLAEEQGSISSREIRAEVKQAGADPEGWREIVQAAGSHLELRGGRYHFVPAASPQREQHEHKQHEILAAIHRLVHAYKKAAALQERRESDRVTFIQPARVRTGDGKEHQLLTRDISASGLRLLGTKDLLGQRLEVTVPAVEGPPCAFAVRIVWTCRVGDDLYENGGVFLELLGGPKPNLRLTMPES